MRALEQSIVVDILLTNDEYFEEYVNQEVIRANMLQQMLENRKNLRSRFDSMEIREFFKEQKKLQGMQEELLEELIP